MKLIALLLCSSIVCLGFSQAIPPRDISVEKGLYAANLNPTAISLSAENRLADEFTLISSVGLGDTNMLVFNSSNYEYTLGYFLLIEPRWYYGIRNRAYHDRNINGNSASFVSIQVVTPLRNGDAMIAGYINWGIRRQFTKLSNFYVEMYVGYGFHPYTEPNNIPNFNIKLGYFFIRS